MTDLMRTIFEYLMEKRVPDLVSREYYWHNTRVLEKLGGELNASLTAEQRDLLETYETTLYEQFILEKEALFQATLSLSRELS